MAHPDTLGMPATASQGYALGEPWFQNGKVLWLYSSGEKGRMKIFLATALA